MWEFGAKKFLESTCKPRAWLEIKAVRENHSRENPFMSLTQLLFRLNGRDI
jgi:hypothetical protein